GITKSQTVAVNDRIRIGPDRGESPILIGIPEVGIPGNRVAARRGVAAVVERHYVAAVILQVIHIAGREGAITGCDTGESGRAILARRSRSGKAVARGRGNSRR